MHKKDKTIIMRLKRLIKSIVPLSIRMNIRSLEKVLIYGLRRQLIRIPIIFNRRFKIILGAAMTRQSGWYSTNEQWLDIASIKSWTDVFGDKQLITNMVAEHVFEHLSADEMSKAIKNIHSYLVEGGCLRIAVPDGNHPCQDYLERVGINGVGPDAADHKQLLTFETLEAILIKNGFKPLLVEGYTDKGDLVQRPWESDRGYIHRSRSSSTKMSFGEEAFIDANTSLIVDAYKYKCEQ